MARSSCSSSGDSSRAAAARTRRNPLTTSTADLGLGRGPLLCALQFTRIRCDRAARTPATETRAPTRKCGSLVA
ncbi:hypothetical protein ACFPRL_13295 [Pseudoclavibacter helvolus]